MTEEEQLQAAMEMSLRDAGLGPSGTGNNNAAIGQTSATGAPNNVPEVACLPPPDRGKPRTFPDKDPQDVLSPPSGFSAKKQRSEPKADKSETFSQLTGAEALGLIRLLFGDRPEVPDVERWLNIGFQFSPLPGTEWGLWQRHGGPCGIFAPVQAFMIKQLLFGGSGRSSTESQNDSQNKERPLATLSAHEQDARAPTLAFALASIIFHAAPSSSYDVCKVMTPSEESASAQAAGDMETEGTSSRGAAAAAAGGIVATAVSATMGERCTMPVAVCRVSRISEVQQLLEEGVDTWLSGPCGVLSFLCSVLQSRSLDLVRQDMDDPEAPLIGRFGHCSQELVNLMLIGEATSNVFDGSRWLGDDPSSGLLVKGVDGDRIGVPPIGFLSELEPMRYLSVGALYKHPEYPIWVLGSPTHYTLLFSTRQSDSQLSEEAHVEQHLKKVFCENAFDDGGLAMAANLGKMLASLGIGADRMPEAEKELVQEDVILWDDFRRWANKQFGVGDGTSSAETACNKLTLFMYDGQDPPGPTLNSVGLELSDIDPALAGGGSEGDAFRATLHTRWPNAAVSIQAVSGALSEAN